MSAKPPRTPRTFVARAFLMPRYHWARPLRTEVGHDAQAGIDAAFHDLAAGERAEIAVLIGPVDPKVRPAGWAAVEAVARGRRLHDRSLTAQVRRDALGALREGLSFLMNGEAYVADRPRPTQESAATARVMRAKMQCPLHAMQILLRAEAATRRQAVARLNQLVRAFDEFDSPFNGLRTAGPRPWRRAAFDRGFADGRPWRGATFYATPDEVEALAGRPPRRSTPGATWEVIRRSGPTPRPIDRVNGLILGIPQGEGPNGRYARLDPTDALKHVLAVGPTGVGKSTFLYWLTRSAMVLGHGALVLDPKGDLTLDLLDAVPASRLADVVFLDLADTDWPVALNPLDVRDAREGEQVAAAVFAMMRELVENEGYQWGTTISQAFGHGFRTLAANPQIEPSMLDLERLFFDRRWRDSLLGQVDDPFVRSYWQNQVDRYSDRQFEMQFGGALRRLAMFVQDPRIRNILVQPRSAVSWDEILAQGRIVLVNLDQADNALGYAGSKLLGSILVSQFWQAVLRRPRNARRPFFAVVDEFQEFLDTGRDMGAFFERARSYGVGMCVATQSLRHAKLRRIADSLLVNTRTHVVFGGLWDQAKAFAMEMAPYFTPDDLAKLDAFHMVIKTVVDNQPIPPFKARVAAVGVPDIDRLTRRRADARAAYGTPRAEVEAMVQARYAGLVDPHGRPWRTPSTDASSGGSPGDFQPRQGSLEADGPELWTADDAP